MESKMIELTFQNFHEQKYVNKSYDEIFNKKK